MAGRQPGHGQPPARSSYPPQTARRPGPIGGGAAPRGGAGQAHYRRPGDSASSSGRNLGGGQRVGKPQPRRSPGDEPWKLLEAEQGEDDEVPAEEDFDDQGGDEDDPPWQPEEPAPEEPEANDEVDDVPRREDDLDLEEVPEDQREAVQGNLTLKRLLSSGSNASGGPAKRMCAGDSDAAALGAAQFDKESTRREITFFAHQPGAARAREKKRLDGLRRWFASGTCRREEACAAPGRRPAEACGGRSSRFQQRPSCVSPKAALADLRLDTQLALESAPARAERGRSPGTAGARGGRGLTGGGAPPPGAAARARGRGSRARGRVAKDGARGSASEPPYKREAPGAWQEGQGGQPRPRTYTEGTDTDAVWEATVTNTFVKMVQVAPPQRGRSRSCPASWAPAEVAEAGGRAGTPPPPPAGAAGPPPQAGAARTGRSACGRASTPPRRRQRRAAGDGRPPLCRYFVNGSCRFGDGCKNRAGHLMPDMTFEIDLTKEHNMELGLEADDLDTVLRITAVMEEGLVSDWNAKRPSMSVKVGDYITKCNGKVCSPIAILKKTQRNEYSAHELRLTIMRMTAQDHEEEGKEPAGARRPPGPELPPVEELQNRAEKEVRARWPGVFFCSNCKPMSRAGKGRLQPSDWRGLRTQQCCDCAVLQSRGIGKGLGKGMGRTKAFGNCRECGKPGHWGNECKATPEEKARHRDTVQ
ncbi:unnamed protein product [Prorocentrum cordatum]|uniref:Cleavage and polyadenylation specificity factor subunit 4 n=1 Tax=Prorocentrum cordatum TaxID=2364126 RepID=A0ABN9WAM2_9DINO|nr:unnamed protein product [Polarella glacialis]